MSTEGKNSEKKPKFTKPRVVRSKNQPEQLKRNQHKTNIVGTKRGPYVFDIPEETDKYSKIVKAAIELNEEYKTYQKSRTYESYRKTRTWLRTIISIAGELRNEVRLDYIEYTNKDVDND